MFLILALAALQSAAQQPAPIPQQAVREKHAPAQYLPATVTKQLKLKIIRQMNTIQQPTEIVCRSVIENGDTIPSFILPTLWVFKPLVFKNKRQERFYWRTVRDVKKVLPLSYYIKDLIKQTNDTLMTMSTKRERNHYMRNFEKRTYKGNEKEFSKLTLNQGMLLIRMVDRTCNATSYDLIKVYLGNFKAGFYQIFAKMLGGDLKAKYGSREEDAIIERVILLVESGQL